MKPIFVIDDDDDVREVVCFALETEGFQVMPFGNGQQALDHLLELTPEDYPGLIISDNFMPQMDGITFINLLKKNYPLTLGTIPLAFSSASGTIDHRAQLPPEIINLNKPMDLDNLLALAKKHCQVG